MLAATVAGFLDTLNTLPLLDAAQQSQVDTLRNQCADLDTLSQELVRRGLLTPFQTDQIARGHGSELVLDQYLLLDLLGQGGMGAVYKAQQRRMKRLVAVKLIRRDALHTPGAVERFQREAEAAAKLSHPNIVTVFDTNQVNGIHFLVMEFIEGTDLARLLKAQGPLPVGFACECVRQAALGLQHAHERGLIHRDIKPHNLMLTKEGVVKVMDMGLARAVRAVGGGLTATGAVMGTPDYLAPEQALNAKGVDIRADVYSLGCTLYHLLTGRTPFVGETVTEKLIKHQMVEPDPVEQIRSGLPRDLPAVVRKMMAKKARHRYQTPGEAAKAVEAIGRKRASGRWPVPGWPLPASTDAPSSVQEGSATWDTKPGSGRKAEEPQLPDAAPVLRRRNPRRLALVVGAVGAGMLTAVGVGCYLFSAANPWSSTATPTEAAHGRANSTTAKILQTP